MMLQPKDYSSHANYSVQVNSAIPEPSAPPYSLLPQEEHNSFFKKKEDVLPDLDPELDFDIESYEHIDQSDVENIPSRPPPGYPCWQYRPFQDRKNPVSVENPRAYQNLYAIRQNLEDVLTKLFKEIIYYAINGVDSTDYIPSFLAVWIPVEIESTTGRRNRYLRESRGNQIEATERCIARNHSLIRRLKISSIETIPGLGIAYGQSINLWHQLREITLIAAIHGHDVSQKDVQAKIFSCLIGGNFFKLAGLSTDFVIRNIAKNMILKLCIKECMPQIIPLNVIFNFFANDAAKVSGHAKKVFAGKYSLPVSGFN
ncbi:MAG: hypothetical protein H0X29_11140 [Parachlamydiaceae bacterium]|nr:hypothetical protein [Parachlamydiaceae bacterium]